MDPQMAYAFPVDDDLTLLAAMPTKDRLPEFKEDTDAALHGMFRSLPDGPPIDSGRRVSKIFGKLDMPNVSRPAAPRNRPCLAFVGDAAMASDPVWGVGCGFAFQSAEWLAEETGDALAGRGDLDAALGDYRRRHRANLRWHHMLMADFATGRRLNPMERLLFSAAARDEVMAGRMEAFGSRNVPVRKFLSPRNVARAAAVNVRHRATGGRRLAEAGAEA
jgi:flavin-dependent dehydrogenase